MSRADLWVEYRTHADEPPKSLRFYVRGKEVAKVSHNGGLIFLASQDPVKMTRKDATDLSEWLLEVFA